MEDEVDVDIEGDDLDENFRLMNAERSVQEELVPLAGRSSSSWILPWELDSSISPENRKAIETMLLEEEYYMTGKGTPEHIWHGDSNKKTKLKRSPSKSAVSTSAQLSRWSKEEKQLFEEGLAQFGRRWTKIAKLVSTRSVLQVKSYARQYFKNKVKDGARASSTNPVLQRPQSPAPSDSSALVNAVRIERLSDDEDVDITDDLCNDQGEAQAGLKTEGIGSKEIEESENESERGLQESKEEDLSEEEEGLCQGIDQLSESAVSQQTSLVTSTIDDPEEVEQNGQSKNVNKAQTKFLENLQTSIVTKEESDTPAGYAGQVEERTLHNSDSLDEIETNGNDGLPQSNNNEKEDDDDDEEEEDLRAPEQEIEMDMGTIAEDEKQAIPEFFEGRSSKTPERYLKIRNYILDQWYKCKPKYLNKTSVRPGLKNCGDVNCIGRIHTYLELIGAINFHCEQAVYNRPRVVDRSKNKEGRDVLEAYQLAQRLQSMRTRKRRVRDVWGNWCDAKDLEGQTYEHLSAEELALKREEMRKQPRSAKMSKHQRTFDPFQLIPCKSFEEDVQEPFRVVVYAETLLIMDMHAHVSRGEVIGLLGGVFNEDAKLLEICAAEPCNSVSTGLQCEMDPVSQTQACEVLSSLGLSVVGWYHSHPSFQPNPSLRDINTQDQFQSYFSRGRAPFIGMIASPYNPANPSPHCQITCLLVKESLDAASHHKLPYKFNFISSSHIPNWDQTMRRAQWIIHKYAQASGSVRMDRIYRRESHLTCLEKMLASLARHLEPLPDNRGDHFLMQIESLFRSDFIPNQQLIYKEEGQPSSISSKSVDSDRLSSDQFICEESSSVEAEDQESNSPTLLHLGSVLSAEHDYLL